jgi:hypothetical protein
MIDRRTIRSSDERAFLYMWHRRLKDVHAMRFVIAVLGNPQSEALAREWLAGYRRLREEADAIEIQALRVQRAELAGVSLLLARMCQFEGLTLAAVAHGVLPVAHYLQPTEGFSWQPSKGPEASEARSREATLRMTDGWERKFYRNGVFVRPRAHSRGRWAAKQTKGLLATSFELDGCLVRSGDGGVATIYVPKTFPHTVMTAMAGRRLADVVQHPVFEDAAFVIRSARQIKGGTRIAFSCPIVPITISGLRPKSGTEHQQIGRDGTLTGQAALEDVLRRNDCIEVLRVGIPQRSNLIESNLLEGADQERVRRINLMAPPWAEPLSDRVDERR